MTLKGLSLPERRAATRAYPCLIVGVPGCGKSTIVEFLTPEEKQETIIIDIENKGLPSDLDSDYKTVVRMKPAGLISPDVAHLYQDYENVKYKTIAELFLYLRKAIAHPDVSRIVIDSFTALVSEIETQMLTVHNGFSSWVAYNAELQEFFNLIKQECKVVGCLLYVHAHYTPAKDPKDKESENFAKVSGNKWYRLVESQFSTVITIEDHKFIADNSNEYDSTRIHRDLSPMETDENSLVELENILCNIGKPTTDA